MRSPAARRWATLDIFASDRVLERNAVTGARLEALLCRWPRTRSAPFPPARHDPRVRRRRKAASGEPFGRRFCPNRWRGLLLRPMGNTVASCRPTCSATMTRSSLPSGRRRRDRGMIMGRLQTEPEPTLAASGAGRILDRPAGARCDGRRLILQQRLSRRQRPAPHRRRRRAVWGRSAAAPRTSFPATCVRTRRWRRRSPVCRVSARAAVSTGYMANLAIVPTLVGRGDAVFADRVNHASLIDAVQLSRAESHRYLHGDVAGLSAMLASSTARRKLILTDAVFSMDGDLAPLPALLELAERHDAWLVIDDAHGFGVLGENGRGSLSHFGLPSRRRVVVLMGTLARPPASPAPSSPPTRWSSSGCCSARAATSSPPPPAR